MSKVRREKKRVISICIERGRYIERGRVREKRIITMCEKGV